MGILSFCTGGSTQTATVSPMPILPPPRPAGSGPPISPGDAETLVGLLTSAQQIELQSAFRKFDINGNGTIDSKELKAVLLQLGTEMSDAQIEDVLRSLDIDQNGSIEWSEFASLMADRWLRQDGDTDMTLALGLIVSEKDGGEDLDLEVVRKMLCENGENPLKPHEWNELKLLADPEGKGRVDPKVFKALPCWETPPPMSNSPAVKAMMASMGGGSSGGS